VDNRFEGGLLAAQRLGALGIVPDRGFGQFQFYFGEALFTVIKVKDTP
jgi:hypothetical protein